MEIRIIYLLLGGLAGLLIGLISYHYYWVHFMMREPEKEVDPDEGRTFPLMKIIPIQNESMFAQAKNTPPYKQPNYFKGRFNLPPEKVTVDKMKEELQKYVDKLMRKEQFLEVNEVQDTINTADEWFDKRKKWFLDQVGKTIFQNNIECECPVCQKIDAEGFMIVDEMHAMDIFLTECVERSPLNPVIFTSKKNE